MKTLLPRPGTLARLHAQLDLANARYAEMRSNLSATPDRLRRLGARVSRLRRAINEASTPDLFEPTRPAKIIR